MSIYYEDAETKEFLTEEEYQKLTDKVNRLKKISIEKVLKYQPKYEEKKEKTMFHYVALFGS